MKYSIIIQYYNEPMLRFTLDSISHYYQGRDDLEVIIVESSANYFSNDFHDRLNGIVRKYVKHMNIKVAVNLVESPSLSSSYDLGVQISSGDIIMLNAPEAAHNFDFLKVIDNEDISNACILCAGACIRLSVDRGTYFNSDFVFDRWLQHSVYQNSLNNLCSIISKDNYLKCKGSEQVKFLDRVIDVGVNLWVRDDLYVCSIKSTDSPVKTFSDIYDKLYAEANYDNPFESDNEVKWGVLSELISGVDFKTILDLGCGRGFYLKKFIGLDKTVFGVELSRVCCDTYLKEIPHVCSDIDSFCEGEYTYDMVLCMDVLEHLEPNKIEDTIEGISGKANVAIFGVANHRDVILGYDLHLCVNDSNWWKSKLSKYYDTVETVVFSEAFYFFKCITL